MYNVHIYICMYNVYDCIMLLYMCSLNENDETLSDNNVDVTLEVNTEADIFVDEG